MEGRKTKHRLEKNNDKQKRKEVFRDIKSRKVLTIIKTTNVLKKKRLFVGIPKKGMGKETRKKNRRYMDKD